MSPEEMTPSPDSPASRITTLSRAKSPPCASRQTRAFEQPNDVWAVSQMVWRGRIQRGHRAPCRRVPVQSMVAAFFPAPQPKNGQGCPWSEDTSPRNFPGCSPGAEGNSSKSAYSCSRGCGWHHGIAPRPYRPVAVSSVTAACITHRSSSAAAVVGPLGIFRKRWHHERPNGPSDHDRWRAV